MEERGSLLMFILVVTFSRMQLIRGQISNYSCSNPLGMENGSISDRNIVATTSSFGNNRKMFGPQRARLRSSSGYRADPSVVKHTSFHFIRVKLPKEMIITGIATQGLGEEWVTKYKLMAGQNGKDFIRFRDINATIFEKEFEGNIDGDNITFNTVPFPEKASEVLVVPTHWHGNIALRFELYGCEPTKFTSGKLQGVEQCMRALGMENGDIPDANIESFDNNNSEMSEPQRARLRSSPGYRADPSAVKHASFHYIKVKLRKEMIITGIATQGFREEWVTRYKLMALDNQKGFVSFRDVVNGTNLEKEFKGNTDGVTIIFNEVPFPVKTSEVLVVPIPTHWHKNIALRLELYGCEPGHFFRVSFEVLNTEFILMYMDREDFNTKAKEEEVLLEVNEYLMNVPGFLSVELYQFSLPLVEHANGDKTDRVLGLIAEITIHCLQNATDKILMQLQTSLASQGRRAIFGSKVLQEVFPVTKKCEPPDVTIALSKNHRNATIKIVTKESKTRPFDLVASLDPECNPTGDLIYSWEVAKVDKESGMFKGPPYPLLKINTKRAKVKPLFLIPYGLYYFRCLTRNSDSVSTLRYDFGFVEIIFLNPFRCEITPIQGKAILERFTLNCYGGYKGKSSTGYAIKFNSSSGPVDITNWRSPSDVIRLPAGNAVDDYSVRLMVEVHFSQLPPLYTHVTAKVTNPTRSDIFNTTETFEKLLREHTFNFSFLQTITESWGLDSISKTKIKSALMRGIIDSKLENLQQLKEEATCAVYSNSIKEETTQEIQNMSLQFLEKAVNFLNKQTGYISNISNITETLLNVVALIVEKATEAAKYSLVPKNDTQGQDKEKAKIITKRAVNSMHRICEMRSRLLRNSVIENTVRMEVRGISVTLAKVNTSKVHKQLLRVKEDEVRLPAEMFVGKWKESLQGGALQVIRFEKNPYSWKDGIITANLSVVDVTFWSSDGARVNISNLNQLIRIVFSRERQNNTDKPVPDDFLFLKRNEMRFHSVNIPSYEATMTVRIKPKVNIALQVYIKKGSRPTDQEYDLTLTLPNVTLPSCLNITKKEHHNCLSRDPYEFVLAPNATGYIGRHFIGIKIQDDSLSTTEMLTINARGNNKSVIKDGDVWGTEKQLCVKVKPPLPTFPRKFNPKTDVNYTFYATVGSCVFWDEVRETWSIRGCQVDRESNETRASCSVNHLTAFSAQFYVAPNKLDFDLVFAGPQPDNLAVLLAVCLIFAFYAIGLVFARKADNRDKMKIVNTKATSHEEEQTDGHSYEVSIQTGMWYRNGTTARVGIRLYGEEGISDTICFMDPWRKTKLFTRASDNKFTINLPVNLGQLYKIQIWHDNSGKSPGWFLYQVVVKDNSTNEKWHFVANRWLAVEELDGAIDVEVRAASKSELRRFKSLFHWRAVTNFTDKHLFLSLFTRPPQNPFTRCQRLTCLLSIIMCSLITNAMFYGLEKGNNSDDVPNSFQLGPLKISLREIVIGIQCGLISLPVGITTVMIFRNIKKTITIESPDRKEKRTQGFLPKSFVVVGWVICLSASISSGTFTIFYSIQWGAEISNQWLLSVGVSVLQDILITGPIIIIINTSITSLLKIKQTVNNDIDTVNKGNLVFHGNGEVNIQQPSEQKLQRLRTMKRQQRKMYRFFMELVLYITFVFLLMTVCYGNRKPSRYQLTKSLKDTFSGFDEVEDPKSFWKWFEEELVPGLYDARLYNGHTVADYEAGLIKSQIGFTVGLPRIRQIRIRPESTCGVFHAEPLLRRHFNRCLSDVSDSNKDTTPQYKPGWMPLDSTDGQGAHQLYNFCPEPWRFTDTMDADELLLSYADGGYIAKVGYDADTALNVKQSLEKFDWIDEKSAAVIVEFLVFEPADMFLTNVMFVFERFTTGGIKTTIDVVPVYIFPSSGSAILLFYRVCILLWSIITLVMFVLEIVKVFKQGCLYFKRFFNWVSFLQLFSSICAMLLVFLKENDLENFLQKIRKDPFGYWIVYELVKWETIDNVVLSITVVFTTIKFLKLMQINRHVHVMKSTLEAAYRYLYSFFFIVLILALAFAVLGTMLFGTMDEEYSTLYYSLSSVFQMAIGIGKMRSKLGGGSLSQVFAPIFLMACMLSLTIVFTDTFIAILDEAYRQANSEKHPGEDLGEYIKDRMKDGLKRSVWKTKKSFSRRPARRNLPTAGIAKHEFNPCNTDATKLVETEPLLSYESILLGEEEVFEETNRPKLAETESLLSDGILSDNDNLDIQSANRRSSSSTEHFVKNNSEAANDTNTKQSRYYFPPTKEDLLLSDVKEAMEFARTELDTYLWKNEFGYISSCSSFSSDDGSFEKWDDYSSLFGYYRSDSDKHLSKYVRCSPENQDKLTLNVLRRYGHTYIEASQDSYI